MEKELDHELEELESQNPQFQKEKELMDQISEIATKSGKSLIEVMSDLLKSNTIKQNNN